MKEVERWAESTDSDVYLISLDAPAERRNVSDGRDGYDNDPTFSPDGTKLAWHSMERPGFESDRNRILVLDLESGEVTEPTAGLDQTVHGATWTADSKSFVFASEWRGTNQLFHLPLGGGEPRQLTEGQHNFGLVDLLPGGEALVSVMDMKRPRGSRSSPWRTRPSAWSPTSTPRPTRGSPSPASKSAGSRPPTARRSTAGSSTRRTSTPRRSTRC